MKGVKSFPRITWLDALCSCIPLQNHQKSHPALRVLRENSGYKHITATCNTP